MFALVFNPSVDPSPNLLLAQTDPHKRDQRTDRAKKELKMELKWDPKFPVPLHFCTPGAAWCPRGVPKHPRPNFHRFGLLFCPPKLYFYRFFTLSFARPGPKHRQEQPRTTKNLPRSCRNTKHRQRHAASRFCTDSLGVVMSIVRSRFN